MSAVCCLETQKWTLRRTPLHHKCTYSGHGSQAVLGPPYHDINPVFELVSLGPTEVNFDCPLVGTIVDGDIALSQMNSYVENLPDNTVISPEWQNLNKQSVTVAQGKTSSVCRESSGGGAF